jgi:hypothetical protein
MNHEIKDLVNQYFTQDNLSTAYPIYWCIEDYVYYPVYSENHHYDRYVLVQDNEPLCYGKDIAELFKNLLLCNSEHKISVNDVTEIKCSHSFINNIAVNDNLIDIYCEEKIAVYKNMFLFKEEAQKHLELNKHHYSNDARIYCCHSWRSPDTEKLLNLLKKEYLTNEPQTNNTST